MTTAIHHRPALQPAPTGRVVRALARQEARRLLRHPLLYLALLAAGWFTYDIFTNPPGWSGVEYATVPILTAPVLLAIAILVAGSFHRERSGLAADAPVGEGARAAGRLLGASPLVLLVALLTAAGAVALRVSGGMDLGNEPGRTLHAQPTAPELLQHLALAVLAVAMGAAAGRRLRHRASAAVLLFLVWFPTAWIYWLFQSPTVRPFALIQTQPVLVEVGPVSADPVDFPASWLLAAPNQYQPYWGRWVVSEQMAAWHDLWLVGLAVLLLAAVATRPWRLPLAAGGLVLAAVAVVMQYAVTP